MKTKKPANGMKKGASGSLSKKAFIGLRLTPDLDSAIDGIAVSQRRGKCEVIRMMIEDALNPGGDFTLDENDSASVKRFMSHRSCETCQHFCPDPDGNAIDGGECRKRAPVVLQNGSSKFPDVYYQDWCSEWALK